MEKAGSYQRLLWAAALGASVFLHGNAFSGGLPPWSPIPPMAIATNIVKSTPSSIGIKRESPVRIEVDIW